MTPIPTPARHGIPPLATAANNEFRHLAPQADQPGITALETMDLALAVLEGILVPDISRTGTPDSRTAGEPVTAGRIPASDGARRLRIQGGAT